MADSELLWKLLTADWKAKNDLFFSSCQKCSGGNHFWIASYQRYSDFYLVAKSPACLGRTAFFVVSPFTHTRS